MTDGQSGRGAEGQEKEASVLWKDIWSVYYTAQIPSRLLDLCLRARLGLFLASSSDEGLGV